MSREALRPIGHASASKTQEGYPVEGELTITLVIESVSGHDAEGIGNNFEQEVIFAKNIDFVVTRIERDKTENLLFS